MLQVLTIFVPLLESIEGVPINIANPPKFRCGRSSVASPHHEED